MANGPKLEGFPSRLWTCSKLTEALERITINDADMASDVYDHAKLSAAADVRRPAPHRPQLFILLPSLSILFRTPLFLLCTNQRTGFRTPCVSISVLTDYRHVTIGEREYGVRANSHRSIAREREFPPGRHGPGGLVSPIY